MTVPNNHIVNPKLDVPKPGERAPEDISDLVVDTLDAEAIWADYRKKDMAGHISLVGKTNAADEED